VELKEAVMNVEMYSRVKMHYKVSLADGEVVEDSADGGPIEVVFGAGDVIPGLERELEGMAPGDEKHLEIAPADAYGERDEEAVAMVPRSQFPPDQELSPGMVFSVRTADGHLLHATLLECQPDEVKMDFNHPLAGKTLRFDVKVLEVSEPDPDAAAACSCGCTHSHEEDCGSDCEPGCGGCGDE
jgi:FKBP-type peptidyl-prolyl cis-trans isomerase 2